MSTEFMTVSRPCALSAELWSFRKIFKVGTVLPNAIIAADVDKDGVDELLLGSTEGCFCIMKHAQRLPLVVFFVPGTISVVLRVEDSLLLISLEGIVCIIDSIARLVRGEAANPVQHSLPANVTCADISGPYVVLGSSDRRVYLYDRVTMTRVRSWFVGSQVFSLSCAEAWPSKPLILVGSTLDIVLMEPGAKPGTDAEKLDFALWHHDLDRRAFSGASGSESKIRLPIATCAKTIGQSTFLTACTEDGYCWMFEVASSAQYKGDGSSEWSAIGKDGFFVLRFLWSCRIKPGVQRIYISALPRPMVVALAGCGALHMIDDGIAQAISKLVPNTSTFALLKSEEKHLSVATCSTEEVLFFVVPTGVVGSEGSNFSLSQRCRERGIKRPDVQRLADVGRYLFPEATLSEGELAQKALQLIAEGYNDDDWLSLQKIAFEGC